MVWMDFSWNTLSIYFGTGSGTFTYPGFSFSTTLYDKDVAFEDFDNDGNMDIVLTATDFNVIKIFYGNGAGGFVQNTINTIHYLKSVTTGDFNKDGIVDARDYIYWRKTNGTATNYQLWRSNLGNRSGGVFGAGADAGGLTIGNVPEPSAGFLVLMAGLLFTAWPRRGYAIT
jgi:hypothetical protein